MLLYLPVSGFRLHFFQIKGKANGKCFALLYLHLAEREHHKKVKCLRSCFPHYSAFSHHHAGKPNPEQIVPKVDPSAAQILSFHWYLCWWNQLLSSLETDLCLLHNWASRVMASRHSGFPIESTWSYCMQNVGDLLLSAHLMINI